MRTLTSLPGNKLLYDDRWLENLPREIKAWVGPTTKVEIWYLAAWRRKEKQQQKCIKMSYKWHHILLSYTYNKKWYLHYKTVKWSHIHHCEKFPAYAALGLCNFSLGAIYLHTAKADYAFSLPRSIHEISTISILLSHDHSYIFHL